MSSTHRISAIVALAQNRAIGRGNELLWRIPDDLKRFKQLTIGHPVIMGRKTFESILAGLGKPLPDRTNIVITRDPDYSVPDGVIRVHSLPEALSYAKDMPGSEEMFVIGGGQIYEAALPFVQQLHITRVEDTPEGADTFFPAYEDQFTNETFREQREHNGLTYTWIDLER